MIYRLLQARSIVIRNDLNRETIYVLNSYHYYELYDIITYEDYENYVAI